MLDSSALANVLAQLEDSLRYLHSDASRADPGLRGVCRLATMHNFKCAYIVAAKSIRRRLAAVSSNPAVLAGLTFGDLMREAESAGIVREAASFVAHRERCIAEAEAYGDDAAERIVTGLNRFIDDVRFLLAQSQRAER